MCNTWLASGRGARFQCAVSRPPPGYEVEPERANLFGTDHFESFADPMDACRGADLVTTTCGQHGWEAENDERLKDFADWQVDAEMMAVASPTPFSWHCLPAHRGEEVTADVIDGAQSVVWDEAEKPPACAEGADGIPLVRKNRIMNIAYFKDMDSLTSRSVPKSRRSWEAQRRHRAQPVGRRPRRRHRKSRKPAKRPIWAS